MCPCLRVRVLRAERNADIGGLSFGVFEQSSTIVTHSSGACVDAVDADGVPPVYISASEGRVPLVRLLLELGSQAVGTPCSNGTSAVHAAAANGSVELLQLLHESGARLDAPDGAGVTPAQLAEREGNTAAAQLLRSASVPGE